jgi:glycerophosphoryl diester phosphodiesterase
VVVIHDQTVTRTTGAAGRVGELSLAELRRLDAGSHFDHAFKGEPIPTLDEVFDAIGRQIYVNVELTNYASLTDDLPEKVAGVVHKHGLARRVLFSSFNPIALLRIRRLVTQAPLGLLALPGSRGVLARSPVGYLIGYHALHPHHQDVTEALVERAHQRGKRVHAFTVNQAGDIRRVFKDGVDGIFTDDPILARQVLAATQTNA